MYVPQLYDAVWQLIAQDIFSMPAAWGIGLLYSTVA